MSKDECTSKQRAILTRFLESNFNYVQISTVEAVLEKYGEAFTSYYWWPYKELLEEFFHSWVNAEEIEEIKRELLEELEEQEAQEAIEYIDLLLKSSMDLGLKHEELKDLIDNQLEQSVLFQEKWQNLKCEKAVYPVWNTLFEFRGYEKPSELFLEAAQEVGLDVVRFSEMNDGDLNDMLFTDCCGTDFYDQFWKKLYLKCYEKGLYVNEYEHFNS